MEVINFIFLFRLTHANTPLSNLLTSVQDSRLYRHARLLHCVYSQFHISRELNYSNSLYENSEVNNRPMCSNKITSIK